MKKWLNGYFDFSRREFNGLMVLITLILLVMLSPYVFSWMRVEEPVTAAEQLAVLKMSVKERNRLAQQAHGKRFIGNRVKKKNKLFVFDPNTLGQTGWERLGLSARQAQAIVKYVGKGGRFRKPEDLQKMYTISDALYARLVPYVQIVAKEEWVHVDKNSAMPKYVKPEPIVVEINGADTIELDKISGIGPTFANRIVKYRERLGGFYKKEQLLEVFGLDSVRYQQIKGQVIVDVNRLRKINVNTGQFDDFRNHPYMRYKQINAIIQYRKQHGNYSNIADLYKVVIMDPETIKRLTPYLEF